MDIVAQLATLLKERTEVGIEGIGTFHKSKIPGKYDANQKVFIPPSYTLQFDEIVSENEALTDKLSDAFSLSVDAARTEVNRWSEQLLEKLSNEGTVTLNNIGELNWQNGHVEFHPFENVDLGNAFFGMPVMEDNPLFETTSVQPVDFSSSYSDESPMATNEENREVLQEMAGEVQQPAPFTQKFDADTIEVKSAPEAEESNEELMPEEESGADRPAYIKWLILLFLLAVGIGILYMAKPDLFNRSTIVPDSSQFNANNLKGNADTLTTDSAVLNDVRTAVTDSSKTQLKDSSSYEIIATAVKGEKESARLIERYNKMGFDAKVIPGKILKKISVASFKTESEARDSLPAVQQRLKNKEIYIYYNKHK